MQYNKVSNWVEMDDFALRREDYTLRAPRRANRRNLSHPQHCLSGLILAILVVAHCGFSVHFPDNILHLFMCLLAICISSLENYLFRPLPFNWAVFLLMGGTELCLFSDVYSSLYILDTY